MAFRVALPRSPRLAATVLMATRAAPRRVVALTTAGQQLFLLRRGIASTALRETRNKTASQLVSLLDNGPLFGTHPWRGFPSFPSLWNSNHHPHNLFGDGGNGAAFGAMDISETDTHHVVTVDVPGLTKDDIKVSVANDILTISGQRERVEERSEPLQSKSDGNNKNENADAKAAEKASAEKDTDATQATPSSSYHLVERSFGSFSRSVRLPKGVDVSKIAAAVTDGVVTVKIPKSATSVPNQIDVPVQ